MSDNAQKTWFADSLNRFSAEKITSAMQVLGKILPCSVVEASGSIVTVKFELNTSFTLPQVTCPSAFPEWIRIPFQQGDAGVVIPSDAYLGGVSGLGGGVAKLRIVANLSALVFVPLGNTAFSAEPSDKIVLYGPNGAILKSKSGSAQVEVDGDNVNITGTLNINGDPYLGHQHTGVQTGGGDSGPVKT